MSGNAFAALHGAKTGIRIDTDTVLCRFLHRCIADRKARKSIDINGGVTQLNDTFCAAKKHLQVTFHDNDRVGMKAAVYDIAHHIQTRA